MSHYTEEHEDHHGHHHPEPESAAALRARALESLLVEKGLLSIEVIDALVDAYEQDIGPLKGARVVARAWSDPAYKQRLLANGPAALAELSITAEELVVVENTPTVHNMIVCTLCSCYPGAVLGVPPKWYKSAPYRSRAVIEPRAVLREFGLELDEAIAIRVWDSSAELRYLVLPERPAGSETLSEEELVKLVTRDSMIGVARAKSPALA